MSKKILLVDDDLDILSALKMLLYSEGYAVSLKQTPAFALGAMAQENFDLILMDLNYSLDTTSGEEGLALIEAIRKIDDETPIVVMTGWGNIEVAVSTMQNGANDFIQKPWDNDRLIAIIHNQIKFAENQKQTQKLQQQNQLLQQQVNHNHSGEIIAKSEAMKQVKTLIDKVAKSDASILLTGENGTGKSMFARYIHNVSSRHDSDLISVNMGAVTESLFESEMFGHVKGAFTDAKSTRVGRFELADTGTLFLDEIANTPYSQQGKLLRVLEDSEFEKVGANKTQSVNIRLICATNANLETEVDKVHFRKDLLYRINTITIEIPALRNRLEDIVPLANSFLARSKNHTIHNQKNLADNSKITLSKAAQQALTAYPWPGNIRELNHVIERAKILCQQGIIELADLGLPENVQCATGSKDNSVLANGSTNDELPTLASLELDIIDQRLNHFNGNAIKAAKSLGLSRSAFYRRMDK
jgi:DNA-binding NtrC family response regulator